MTPHERDATRSVSNVLVRRGHQDDLARVVELLRECVQQMWADGIDQWDDVYPTAATLTADVAGGSLYVASAQGAPIAGAFAIDERQEPEYAEVPWSVQAPRVAVVHRLMVHPRWQGRGLGPFLMRFAELRARQLGYRALRLDAFTRNTRSLRLYQRLGYRDAGPVTFRKGLFRCFEKDLAADAR
jgi:GNAT superfamily N-acetyltransferase